MKFTFVFLVTVASVLAQPVAVDLYRRGTHGDLTASRLFTKPSAENTFHQYGQGDNAVYYKFDDAHVNEDGSITKTDNSRQTIDRVHDPFNDSVTYYHRPSERQAQRPDSNVDPQTRSPASVAIRDAETGKTHENIRSHNTARSALITERFVKPNSESGSDSDSSPPEFRYDYRARGHK